MKRDELRKSVQDMPLEGPTCSTTEASMMKLNMIWVSLIFPMRRCEYFSVFAFFPRPSLSAFRHISWYEFLNFAERFSVLSPPFGAIFRDVPGPTLNSIGLTVMGLRASVPSGDGSASGPLMTADCLAKENSISSS